MNNQPANDYVVLLHGISRTKQIMTKMEQHLLTQGYDVYNDSYLSTSFSIEKLAERIWQRIETRCSDTSKKIHFVGHSMGGLIVRCMIAQYQPENLGRVVMLGPPNQGSRLVDLLKRFNFYHRNYGPSGQQLGTEGGGTLSHLPPIDYDLGIIAGDRTIDWLFSWFVLSGKNDGKITVEETKLEGMKDHIVLHATHTYMPSNPSVMHQTTHFLQKGAFLRE